MDGLKRVVVIALVLASTSYCGSFSPSVDQGSRGGSSSTGGGPVTAGKSAVVERPGSSAAAGSTALGVGGSNPSLSGAGSAGSAGLSAHAEGGGAGGATSGVGGNSGVGGSSVTGGSAGSNAIDCGGVVRNGEVRIETSADVAAFAGVTQVTGTLFIRSGLARTDLSELGSLRCIADLWVEKSALVSTRGLSGVVSINSLIFEDNGALERIEGFDSLVKLNFVRLRGNRALTKVELPNITQLIEMMLLGDEQLTRMNGFENLKTISGNLFLDGVGFKDLSALSALESVTTLEVRSNPQLESFAGFENLKQIKGNLWVSRNPLLDNIDALGGLYEIRGDIIIDQNQRLTQCEISKTLDGVPMHGTPQIGGSPACSP